MGGLLLDDEAAPAEGRRQTAGGGEGTAHAKRRVMRRLDCDRPGFSAEPRASSAAGAPFRYYDCANS